MHCRSLLFILTCIAAAHTDDNPHPSANTARVYRSTHALYLKDFFATGEPLRPDVNYCYADVTYPHINYSSWRDNFTDEPEPYHALTLENDRLKLVQLPELGGQTFVFRDRRTGMDIAYSSPNPRLHRSFCLQKAMHVFFPVTEHGLNSLETWPFSIRSDSLGAYTVFTKHDDKTGLRLEVTTFMPHDGYYIDVTATMTNPTHQPHKAMMWILHVVETNPGSRLFFPTSHVSSHTGMDAVAAETTTGGIVGLLAPYSFPDGAGVDLSYTDNWPSHCGMYARTIERPWAAMHNLRQKRGLIKILDPATAGFKYYCDHDHMELFSGSTETLESYGIVEPGESLTLSERIIPTVGLIWISKANRHGALALYRVAGDDSLRLDALPAAPPVGADSLSLVLSCGGQTLHALRSAAVAGDPLSGALHTDALPRAARRTPLRLVVSTTTDTLIDYTVPLDSIAVLDTEKVHAVPKDSILATQASAWVPDDDRSHDASITAPRKPRPLAAEVEGVFFPYSHFPPSTAATLPPHPPWFKRGGAAIRNGARTYVLARDHLHIVDDHTKSKPAGIVYGYNSPWQWQIDSSYRHEDFEANRIRLDDASWYGDLAIVDSTLVIGVGKRLELRDLDGTLRRSIDLGTWPGGLAVDDEGKVVVTLPYHNAVRTIDLKTDSSATHSLGGTLGFRHPWAITRTPEGWAISSAVDRTILVVPADWSGGRVLRLPYRAPWKHQITGVPALEYHPRLACLLAADPDSRQVLEISLAGDSLGVFLEGGEEDSLVMQVRHLRLDSAGTVLVTQWSSSKYNQAQVKLFSPKGTFLGVQGHYASGRVNEGLCLSPFGTDGHAAYRVVHRAIHAADSNGFLTKSAAGFGWAPGQVVWATGAAWRNAQGVVSAAKHGWFIADVFRHAVIHYDETLAFAADLTPPNAATTFAPVALAVDAEGRLHALDGMRNHIVRFVPDSTGSYLYDTTYARNAPIPMQRLFAHGPTIVALDVFGERLCRFGPEGQTLATHRTPPGFRASIFGFEDRRGNLRVKEFRSARCLTVTPQGACSLDTLPAFGREVFSIVDLADYPDWHPPYRPDSAAFAIFLHRGSRIFLDEELEEIEPVERPLVLDDIHHVTRIDSTIVMSVKGYRGVVTMPVGDTALTRIPVAMSSAHFDILRKKRAGVVGGITCPPRQYVEFTLDGTVITEISPLPAARLWTFGYTPEGNLLVPDNATGRLYEVDSTGRCVRKLETGVRRLQSAVAAPDGRLYALGWDGEIQCFDTTGAARTLMDGSIEGEKRLGKCAWLELWDGDKLVVGDNRNGRVHVLGTDGAWYGAVLDKDRRWRNSLWGGHSPRDGEVIFWGHEGLHEVKLSEGK
jgi:hypothetical protein